jgi:multidrug efflux pump subunit AcrA (membrane-fusion protein)
VQAAGMGGPSLAQNQLQQGLAGSLAANTAAVAATRGLNNPGVAQKQLLTNQANQNAQSTQAAANTRATQQITSQNQLANVQAQAEQNAQAQAQLNEQAQLAYNQQVYGLTAINQQNSNALTQSLIGMGTNAPGQILSAGGQALATYGKLSSDKTGKKDIKDVSASQMLDALSSKSYSYKDPTAPGAAPGTHVGIMAQDLMKSKTGKTLVTKMPDGKMGVDTGRLALALAGAAGELHQRVKALEASSKNTRK